MKSSIAVTVDAVIFTDTLTDILLIKRKNDPYKEHWALPGGFVDEQERLVEACIRELEEETGLTLSKLQQVGIYDEPNRDPRGRTLSIAFTAKLVQKQAVQGADDALKAQWVALNKLPDMSLAFDHRKIIQQAIQLHQS